MDSPAPVSEPMPDHWHDAMVLILAHGSETTPSAAKLVKDHAALLKSQNLFADVRAVFLRDTPHPRQVIEQSSHTDIYIVPFMISEGYSIEVLIPAALGLTGPLTERISETGRRRIHVCHSIGTHDHITDQIVAMISNLISDSDLDPGETIALVTAHGTKRHPGNNQQSTHVATRIAMQCSVSEAHAVFLEETPFIDDWRSLARQNNVLIVPHLMTLGSHATQDVPTAMGIPPGTPGFHETLRTGEVFGPHDVGSQKLWYAPVVGYFDSVPGIIIDRIRDWDRVHAD